jgi:uncharacterized membrane protein YphA (DoxX/SURF4 family)
MMKKVFVLFALIMLVLPSVVSAHEMYVLDQGSIQQAMNHASPNPFDSMKSHAGEFIIWVCAILLLFYVSFKLSFSSVGRKISQTLLFPLRKYAPVILRVTLGLSLLFCAYTSSLFGPELPLVALVGSYVFVVRIVLALIGCLLICNIAVRIACAITALLFIWACISNGMYMLVYAHYLVLALVLPFLEQKEISYLWMRVGYGVSIISAALFAKAMHSNLALETISHYHLTDYLHFDPLFLTLGALLVEITVGLCILIGFEIRCATLVFTLFMLVSMQFFGEAVWPHVILFGLNIGLFARGYDRYTIVGRSSSFVV